MMVVGVAFSLILVGSYMQADLRMLHATSIIRNI
jgi:hypothetical protein